MQTTLRNPARRAPLWLAASLVLAGCGIFGDDKLPEDLTVQIQGETGTAVDVVVARQFVSGVDELGVTQIQLLSSDTLSVVLPMDSTFDIRADRQFFAEVIPAPADTLEQVRFIATLDGRSLFNEQGSILPESPFRFVYVFNQPTTRTIEVF